MTGAELESLSIGELMTTQVVVLDPSTSLQKAISLMVGKGIRHLPVVKDGKVVAIISDRDVRLMVTDLVDPVQRKQYLESNTVMKHASSPVTTGHKTMSAKEVARIFVETRIGCLPIVDEQQTLIGIVTQTDLLKWIAQLTE